MWISHVLFHVIGKRSERLSDGREKRIHRNIAVVGMIRTRENLFRSNVMMGRLRAGSGNVEVLVSVFRHGR
jgi:hypothetical protein